MDEIIRFNIQAYEDREKMVMAFANSGYPVKVITTEEFYRKIFYWVVVGAREEVKDESEG